jgi:hypothetical protein
LATTCDSSANQWTFPTLGLTWFYHRSGMEKLMLISKILFEGSVAINPQASHTFSS